MSAYLSRASSVQPPSKWYGVYCENIEATWQPGGARVGSRELGRHNSNIGLDDYTFYKGTVTILHYIVEARQLVTIFKCNYDTRQ